MKLIEDWKRAHKFWSMRAGAAAVTLQGTWLGLPDAIKAPLPASMAAVVSYLVIGLTAFAMVVRMIDQSPPEAPEDKS